MEYLKAFLCGGLLCLIGQVLIDRTQLTPARILTGYVVAGVFLSAVGLYQPLADWGGAGATVPLTGFGHSLAKGVEKAVAEKGWLGVLTGGLSGTAAGITAAVTLGGIAAISLVVGGIGIMNIMLVTVTERTREIGIRRAIGATRASIVSQFLIEAAMLCGLGGIVGILVGTVCSVVLSQRIVQMTIYPALWVTLAAFGLSVLLGVLFGSYPAAKASKLQPVEALRAE